jgi:hypothetical protein
MIFIIRATLSHPNLGKWLWERRGEASEAQSGIKLIWNVFRT